MIEYAALRAAVIALKIDFRKGGHGGIDLGFGEHRRTVVRGRACPGDQKGLFAFVQSRRDRNLFASLDVAHLAPDQRCELAILQDASVAECVGEVADFVRSGIAA